LACYPSQKQKTKKLEKKEAAYNTKQKQVMRAATNTTILVWPLILDQSSMAGPLKGLLV